MAHGHHDSDYHNLLPLHHALRLRRRLRGDPGAARVAPDAPTLASWPERRRDQQLLRESLAGLGSFEDALLNLYTILFREQPHLRTLFPESLTAQRDALTHTFRRLIDALDQPETLAPAIEALGRDHRKHGIRPAHYHAFVDALVESLRATAGNWWCDEYEQAWRRLYWFVAKLMIEAAERATSEPPYVEAVVTDHDRRQLDLAILRLRTTYPYRFEAGQHATVQSPRLPQTWRSYSMATPPGDDGVVEFHVRARGAGGLSDVLVRRTRPGDLLRLGPARGDATLARARQGDLLLVAGGTGLAPIKSLLGELGRASYRPRTSLFIGARSPDDFYDLRFLAELTEDSSWLRLVLAVSEEVTSLYEMGQLPDVLARFGPWTGCTAFVAGPPGLVTTLRHRLPALGVPTERIVHEPE